MCGVLSGGCLTALMGPSGSGKSTLLNCIAGRIPCDGRVSLRFPDGDSQQGVRIGFVPQTDHLFTQFSVRETVLFASRLNNRLQHGQHLVRVDRTIRHLDLLSQSENQLNTLSGGQLKRVSIAMELVSQPAILLLDEPTTGLDSDTSESLVRLLKQLATSGGHHAPAIMATIHTPSADTFLMFDQVYLLDRRGANIFAGPPDQVTDYFVSFGFQRKTNISPAEYMIEIADRKSVV